MNAEDKRRSFELLDDYARRKHSCFVSEFFEKDANVYLACFRPLGNKPCDPSRYACEYIAFDPEQLKESALERSLAVTIRQRLDEVLEKFRFY
jgi:hypothetical protein